MLCWIPTIAITLRYPTNASNAFAANDKRCSLRYVAVLLMSTIAFAIAPPAVTAQGSNAIIRRICSFETEVEARLFMPNGCHAQRVKEHATHGEWALRVRFPGSEKDTWPGLSFRPTDELSDWSRPMIVVMDVYNPQDEIVRLSWRIDDVDGKHLFGGMRLPPNRITHVEIWTPALRNRLNVTRITQFYPYIRIPREDVVLYFDNIRFEQLKARFKRIEYRDDLPMLKPDAEELMRGWITFARSYLDVVFPQSHPHEGERVKELSIFAARGEREPLTFCVYALRQLRNVRIRIEDFTHVSGNERISTEWVDVRIVQHLNKRVTYSSWEYIADMPSYLESFDAVDIAPNRTRRFY